MFLLSVSVQRIKSLKHDCSQMRFMIMLPEIGDIMLVPASTEVEQLILNFLESEAKVSCSSQAMMANAHYPNYSQRVPRQMTGDTSCGILRTGTSSDDPTQDGSPCRF